MTVAAAAPAWTPRTWTWQGHRICWTRVGEGQPLLLIHGFGASIGHWSKNMPALAAAGYEVWALDLLGFGASDKPVQDYSLDLWLELLHDFWAEHIQRPVVPVGNSIGALLALMLTTRHPDLTRGAVLLNCAGGLNHRPEELVLPLRLVMGGFAWAVNHPWIGPLLFEQVRRPASIRRTLYQVYGNRESVTDELVELLYRPSCDPTAQQVFAAILRAPAGPTPQELLAQLTQPLLVLWGASDPWTPIQGADCFRQPAEGLAIEFHALADTGHCPHDDRPEVVHPRLLDWLARLG